ncbi:LacI family transcriptional regulator [Streptomyces sp. NBC_00090]|uniref:LacI family DNA-binding transcriptional regulator n=1 Tax=Streptomyces sp. NBC_00090 TaxID=2903619 RepID=UPI0032435A61
MRPSQRVGIKDVARTAGVSIGTVSNVLNHPEVVSPPTRSLVMSVVDSLSYVRLAGARQLRGNASSQLLALYGVDVTDPRDASLAAGVEQAAEDAGLGVLMCGGGRETGRMRHDVALLASYQVRGVIVATFAETERTVAACTERGMACVVAGQGLAAADTCSVTVDDHTGGRVAAAHLIAQGHRSVVVVGDPGSGPMMRQRYRGAMECLKESRNGAVRVTELATEGTSVGAGRDAGQRLLGVVPRPTAVLCFHDLLTLGLMQALHEAGIRVPHDVAVAGYEDLAFAAASVVPLTSVRRPAHTMGMRAGRLLIEHTAQDAHEHVHEVLTPELVVRRSTLSIPA